MKTVYIKQHGTIHVYGRATGFDSTQSPITGATVLLVRFMYDKTHGYVGIHEFRDPCAVLILPHEPLAHVPDYERHDR